MNSLSFFKWIPSIGLCLMLFSCSNTKGNTLPNPEIKDGIARISGRITNFHPIGRAYNPTLGFVVHHPVTAETYRTTTAVDEDGTFSFEVPMQCSHAIGYINPQMNNYVGFYVCLISGEETKIDIVYKETGQIKSVNQIDSLELTSTDQTNKEIVSERLYNSRTPGLAGYAKTPDEFVQRAKISLNNRLKMIAENDVLSEIAKDFVANEMKLFNLGWGLLDYRAAIRISYLNAGNADVENFNPPEPGRKHYAFLKDFNLNNPQYLYQGGYYSEVLQRILFNDTLNIPPIGDSPVDSWMKDVKKNLSKLVGFDKGLFYDLLAANSYAQQFDHQLKPLSDKQKENIRNYFKDEKVEIAKILLKKDNEISQLAAQKEPLIVNETPAVAKENLMDAIVSKYKEKVIVVDFWATWCGPCLKAMNEYRTVKGELKGKNVVFVYLTNHSSPQKLWEERIKGIGGEHYYLNKDEWEYITSTFGFEYIPSYVIFDTKGQVSQKFVSYPGNEKMQATIESLLR